MNINLYTWYSERELDYCPKHFVPTNTSLSEENHLWIYEKTQGRFFIGSKNTHSINADLFSFDRYPYFEDPQEAVLYELTWS